jgi:hypothetical protein
VLRIEFDDDGNPYLADEADAVDRPACGCGEDVPALDEDDPEAAFEAIVESVPEEVRTYLEDDDRPERSTPTPEAGSD